MKSETEIRGVLESLREEEPEDAIDQEKISAEIDLLEWVLED